MKRNGSQAGPAVLMEKHVNQIENRFERLVAADALGAVWERGHAMRLSNACPFCFWKKTFSSEWA